jgi:hypothetical protein
MLSFHRIGWNNRPALGISCGCYYSYKQNRLVWFDEASLEMTVRQFVAERPLIVTFNGTSFDLTIMRGLLRRREDLARQQILDVGGTLTDDHYQLAKLCDQFKADCERSFDLLQALWDADPAGKKIKGINGLDDLCQANGLPGTVESGALMPALWKAGECARVLNHCADEVYNTKAVLELVLQKQPLKRRDGSTVTVGVPQDVHSLWWKYRVL